MKRFTALLLTLTLLCTSILTLSGSAAFTGDLGDINNDGSIDASDALVALQHSVKLTALTGDAFERGEVNGDAVIDATDALYILQYSVKLITEFPRILEPEVLDFDTSKAYELDPTADTSFSVSYDNLAAKTIYLLRGAALRNSNRNIETDTYRFSASLQGLVNRDFNGKDKTSMVFVLSDSNEKNWLEYMQAEGKFLNGYETVEIKTFNDYLTTFEAQIRSCGIVLWDTQVPSTANVAATICGVDGYLPVKYDTQEGSLYNRLIEYFGEDIVKFSLVNAFRTPELNAKKTFEGFTYTSSGSSKCDAYLWAVEAYMNRCSAKYMAYVLDGAGSVDENDTYKNFTPDHTINCVDNHDYFIARRCFFFDLSPVGDEAACDDPTQPIGTDLETMKKILQARYDHANGEFAQIFGFPPWHVKYTSGSSTGSHDPVWVEWTFVDWCSAYNLAVEADAPSPANMYNASLYYKYIPSVETYVNNEPAEQLTFDETTFYYTFYVGDYDSAIWMKYYIEKYWMTNTSRGQYPLGWAFNPNLADRLPMLFDYAYENKTQNDFFMTGDSGAGYVVPSQLFESGDKRTNPDGTEAYIRYAKAYYKKFDMDITGFILNSFNPVTNEIRAIFNELSPKGSFEGPYMSSDGPLVIYNGVPYLFLLSGISDKNNTNQEMYNHMLSNWSYGSNFMAIRYVVESPDYLNQVVNEYEKFCADKGMTVKYVAPETIFDLILQSGQGTKINN